MLDLYRGFRIDGTFLPWGIQLAEASTALGVPVVEATRSATVPCPDAYGFEALSARLTAPALDRPVTSVTFALSPPGPTPFDATFWVSRLSARLGAPGGAAYRELPSYGDPSDAVVFNGHWENATFRVGLVVYGGLRRTDGGLSAAMMSMDWNETLAAQPYIRDWRRRVDQLAQFARRRSAIDTFAYDEPLAGLYWGQREGEAPAASIRRREVYRSLHHPNILTTPDTIAAEVRGRGFAIWTSAVDGVWCISTPWDSVMFALGSPVSVDWTERLTAKSGGFSELAIGAWYVRGGERSREIAAAAAELESLPGVTVRYREGYNY